MISAVAPSPAGNALPTPASGSHAPHLHHFAHNRARPGRAVAVGRARLSAGVVGAHESSAARARAPDARGPGVGHDSRAPASRRHCDAEQRRRPRPRSNRRRRRRHRGALRRKRPSGRVLPGPGAPTHPRTQCSARHLMRPADRELTRSRLLLERVSGRDACPCGIDYTTAARTPFASLEPPPPSRKLCLFDNPDTPSPSRSSSRGTHEARPRVPLDSTIEEPPEVTLGRVRCCPIYS